MMAGKIIKSSFNAPWWLKHPLLQTSFAVLGRARLSTFTFWEELSLPDGDFVDLCWFGNQAEGPIAVLMPGLEGGIHAHYITALVEPLMTKGWRVVVMHFRTCSGRMNQLARGYAASDSEDLEMAAASIRMQNPGVNMVGIGFSLGASVLLKSLSELSEHYFPSSYFSAAVAVSVPFDLSASVDQIPLFYQRRLLKSMKEKIREKINAGFDMPVTMKQLNEIQNLREFDQKLTAPLHLFEDVESYYQTSSCRSLLHKIKVPTLIIHAEDDPFVPKASIPTESELAENMELRLSSQGGHLGFLGSYFYLKKRSWLTKQILEYIEPLRQ